MKINFIGKVYIQKHILKKIKKNIFFILNNFFPKYTIDIFITNNEKIKGLNYKFRNINLPTDVLSFPIYNFKNSIPLEIMKIDMNNKIFIGDIVISLEKVIEQAFEFNNRLEQEFIFLFIHSMLHLIGYDHILETEKKIMRKEEKKIMSILDV